MKYLILGKTGLLGQALIAEAEAKKLNFIAAGSSQEDLLFNYKLEELFEEAKPNVIINTIAYTNVDQAELNRYDCSLLNSIFPNNLAVLCKINKIKLVHISTDYVFDGLKSSPYNEDDLVNPQSVYGETKLAGENSIITSGLEDWLILRISWLFGPHKDNFLSKILKRAISGTDLKIVNDQFGNPTYTLDLAVAIFELIKLGTKGLFHFANSDSCTWYEFALNFLNYFPLNNKIDPCSTDQFKTLAIRPKNSKFDLTKISTIITTPRSWKDAVKDYVNYLKFD